MEFSQWFSWLNCGKHSCARHSGRTRSSGQKWAGRISTPSRWALCPLGSVSAASRAPCSPRTADSKRRSQFTTASSSLEPSASPFTSPPRPVFKFHQKGFYCSNLKKALGLFFEVFYFCVQFFVCMEKNKHWLVLLHSTQTYFLLQSILLYLNVSTP